MKILRLDLRAFGPFTDVMLPLEDGDHGLHMIYGPNEAGKSSALRALRQLLYGIPHQSNDDFIHPYRDMRIGAALRSIHGTHLECVRRKRNKNSLLAADNDEPIDPQRLAELLNGVDEESFRQRFGIDYENLVEGGHAIVQGGGDLGTMLFAAASGVADLGAVLKRLEAEAEALFKPAGKNPAINKALAELQAKRKQVKEAQLPGSQWSGHQQALAEAGQRKETLEHELRGKGGEKSRLQRFLQALPLIVRRTRLREELAQVQHAPLLPDDFGEQRRDALTERNVARKAEQEAGAELERLQRSMAELDVPQVLLEQAEIIERQYQQSGSYQKARNDQPDLIAGRQRVEAEVRSILREELGRDLELSQAGTLRVRPDERVRIQELGNQYQALLDQCETARSRVGDLEEKIRLGRGELESLQAGGEQPAELRRAVSRAQQQGNLQEQLDAACQELQRMEQQANIDLQKLPLWTGTLEALETLAVPPLETVERAESEMNEAAAAVKEGQQRVAELQGEILDKQRQIDALQQEQDVPSQQDLLAARRRRDQGWQLVRRAWEDPPGDVQASNAFVADCPPAANLAEAYQISVQQADRVADRLRGEAEQVTQKATLIADRQERSGRQAHWQQRLEEARRRADQLQQQWEQLWEPLDIRPLSAREMRSWLGRHAALLAEAESVRRQRQQRVLLQQRMADHCQELSQCLASLGEPAGDPGETFASLLQRSQDLLDHLEKAVRRREQLHEQLAGRREELLQARRQQQQSEQKLEQWRTQWAEALQRLALRPEASPSEANSVLAAIDHLLARLKEAENLQQRITGIDRDCEQFERTMAELLEQLAPDLAGTPVAQVAAELNARLSRARRAQTRLEDLQQQQQRQSRKREDARASLLQAQAALDIMCGEAGCSSPDDLPAAEQRSARRKAAERDLQQVDEQLLRLAAKEPLEAFLSHAEAMDADQLQPAIGQLEAEIERLEAEKSVVDQTIGSERKELQRMDGTARAAAQADEDAQALLAQIRAEAEQYARLRLAAAVLRNAIERYREKNQGPVLRRASSLFAELTLGSFEGLRADYNERGEAVLVGVRPGGRQTVAVEGMSDGTCDQLYLVLRLASLEHYLDHNPPIPFIADDILIKFDDRRAIAALQALAQLSQRTQVIFFTHHEHLLELAQQHLDPDLLFIHQLHATAPQEDVPGIVSEVS